MTVIGCAVAALCLAASGSTVDAGSVRGTAAVVLRPQIGIDGVVLRESMRDVRADLGRPSRSRELRQSEGGEAIKEWRYAKRRLTVELRRRASVWRVWGVASTSSAARTASGVGIGSSERDLVRELSGIDCFWADDQRWCTIGSGRLGTAQTVFVLRRGRVASVRVAISTP